MEPLCAQLSLVKDKIDILASVHFDDAIDNMSQDEAAKFHIALAYTLASLFYMLERCSGSSSVFVGRISDEIGRIKQYVEKLSAHTGESSRKRSRVDSSAAARMIAHQLS